MSPANQVISLNITMYKVMNKGYIKHGSKAINIGRESCIYIHIGTT